ncbi:MAG TPA: NADH-quinone oxidoreductase subunit L [Ktedonobacteraceae bacterium]|jgi:NADH-quinone oxidoreductase subunit L
MTNLTVWVLVFPLLGFVLLSLFGRALPRPAVLTIAWGASGLALFFATIGFLSILQTRPDAARLSDQVVYTWVNAGAVATGVLSNNIPLNINLGLLLDPLSATMLMIVTGVGFLIHLYSAGYMEGDPGFGRFFAYLNFFLFAMVLLVSADNFLFLLVGWALVGLASFLLIGFWFTRQAAVAAARKALVINIIGDFGLLLAIFLIFQAYHTLNYLPGAAGAGVLTQVTPGAVPVGLTTAICLLLFVGCAAKSAQLPLYMWLPDAMEGPTPVSALIHAATMVTAGVYLVARANPLFQVSPPALLVVAIVGGATALFSATIALTQLDIKRVLAYSTISQLGYMFLAEGAQNYTAGIFHLTTHAYFKALLFLGAGSVIHALGGEQDLRQMGGLRRRLKITFWTFLVAALAISGIIPFAGFWSKDEVVGSLLARALDGGGTLFYVLWAVALVTAGLTAFYMFRLVFGMFFGSYRGSGPLAHGPDDEALLEETPARGGHGGFYAIYESPALMTVPLLLLALLSAIGGLVGSYALFGAPAISPFAHFLSPLFTNQAWTGVAVPEVSPGLGLNWLSSGASLGLAALGILVAWLRYRRGFVFTGSRNPLYLLSFRKYYVDELCRAVIVTPLLWSGRVATALLEGSLLNEGSQGIGRVMSGVSLGLRRLQTGYMRNYALAILFGVVLLLLYYVVMRG